MYFLQAGLLGILSFILCSFCPRFVFEPYTIIAFTIGIVLIFIPEAIKGDAVGNFIRLGSIILISPLAFFFGRNIRKAVNGRCNRIYWKRRRRSYKKEKKKKKKKKVNLSKEDLEKLSDVVEETEKTSRRRITAFMKITSSYFRIALALILIIIAFTILRNRTLAQSASNNPISYRAERSNRRHLLIPETLPPNLLIKALIKPPTYILAKIIK